MAHTFKCHTTNIPELYQGADHYVSASSEFKRITTGPGTPDTEGWYTIYELVLSPLQRITIMEQFEPSTYDAMLRCIYLAERGWYWNREANVPAMNSKAFDSVATENWVRRIGFLLCDDRMTDAMFSEVSRILNYMKMQRFFEEKEVANETKEV